MNYNFLPCLVRDIGGYFRVDSAGIFSAPLFLDIFVICRGNARHISRVHHSSHLSSSTRVPRLRLCVPNSSCCHFFFLFSLTDEVKKKRRKVFFLFFFKKQVEKGINFEAALNDSPK